MKIVIDLTSLSYHITGIERYAMCISKSMVEYDEQNDYILIFRNEIHEAFKSLIDDKKVKAKILHGNNKLLFNQLVLPINLFKIKADRYLFFAFVSPLLFRKTGIFNTIHDMGAWDVGWTMKFLQKIYHKVTIWNAKNVSKGIITVSKFSKNRIHAILKYNLEKILVAYSGISGEFPKDLSKYQEEKNNNYVLTLSTIEPRKNMEYLIKIFKEIEEQVDYKLIIIGRKGWKTYKIIEKYKSKKIVFTGFVADNEIVKYYHNALCFIFPSVYEGFGLPPLEALCFSTVVMCSDIPASREILRNQAIYFDLKDKQKLKCMLLNIHDIIKNAPRCMDEFQMKEFNYNQSAKKILNFIK